MLKTAYLTNKRFIWPIKTNNNFIICFIDEYRNAIEYEKKTYASNLEHRQTMDKNIIIMTREVEKLRVELSNAEKRARAAAPASSVTVLNPSKFFFMQKKYHMNANFV